jgi:drug/metabolite transporter (DMT)-like permease
VTPPDSFRRAAAYAVAAAVAAAVTGVCVRAAAAAVGTEVVVFFRSAIGGLVLLPWMLRGGGAAMRTQRFGGHLWRAGFGICAMYAFFYGLAHLPLSEALLLTYSTPLYLPFLAWIGIGERPHPVVFPAAAVGLAGIACIVKPAAVSLAEPAPYIGAASGLLAAAAMVSIRRISDTEPATRIVFYFSGLSTAVSAVPLAWAWRAPEGSALALLIATGVFATVVQLCLTRAYSLAPAARIGPFTYTSVIFAGVAGWLLWDEVPDALSVLGMTLVIASCVMVGWRYRAA